jgi:hypothetical protein
MKLIYHALSQFALATVCLGLAGCQSEKNIAHLTAGYEEVTHSTHNLLVGEPEQSRISFQHRGADDKIVKIWPSLSGAQEVIKGDVAIFVGDKAYVDPEKVTRSRLFAVKSPELPLDITDEMLWRWSQTAGKDFAKALQRFNLVVPEEKNGRLALHLEFSSEGYMSVDKDWPDHGDLQLDWKQVTEMMSAVKTKGVVEKDFRWHTPYIGERF